MLFGHDSAEHDDLLMKCALHQESLEDEDLPIVTGRWGSGKTASLLLRNRVLSESLNSIDSSLERAWFLDEKGMNPGALIELFANRANEAVFKHRLRTIWRAEIIRRASCVLGHLHKTYGAPSGVHWRFVTSMAKGTGRIASPIWSQLPHVMNLLGRFDDAQYDSIAKLKGQIDELFSTQSLNAVQLCLSDIEGKQPKPVIGIEPIETPSSSLEDEASLAHAVVQALLNVFIEDFQVSSRQLLRLNISIPWHRIAPDDLLFPQKVPSYLRYLTWSRDELREFMNRRIQFEFKQHHRSFTPTKGGRDAWSTLFEDRVKNDACEPICYEDSFAYVLRHTHHRPRDVQQIARLAAQYCATDLSKQVSDVIKGRGGLRIHGKYTKKAVADVCTKSADLLVTEARRRLRGLGSIVDALRGIAVPFSPDSLKARLENAGLPNQDIGEAIESLWQAGIVGVEIKTSTAKNYGRRDTLPEENKARFDNVDGASFTPFYFFYYNYSGECRSLLQRADLSVKLVLHPRTYETLMPRVPSYHPIGI